MRETIHERRFKRDLILGRVKLHLAHQQDMALPMPIFRGINQAYSLVSGIHRAALQQDVEQLKEWDLCT